MQTPHRSFNVPTTLQKARGHGRADGGDVYTEYPLDEMHTTSFTPAHHYNRPVAARAGEVVSVPVPPCESPPRDLLHTHKRHD